MSATVPIPGRGCSIKVEALSTQVLPVPSRGVHPDAIQLNAPRPIMCAGIPADKALSEVGAHLCDFVAMLGIGGLGYVGAPFACRMGFKTAAVARASRRRRG
jgi:D-arabinose 1-dehydrogenase-like Zn-dependent alcohol dehydrogenase